MEGHLAQFGREKEEAMTDSYEKSANLTEAFIGPSDAIKSKCRNMGKMNRTLDHITFEMMALCPLERKEQFMFGRCIINTQVKEVILDLGLTTGPWRVHNILQLETYPDP